MRRWLPVPRRLSIPAAGGEVGFALQWNDGYGADSGPSRSDSYRPAIRPTEASKAAVCYVRATSTPAVR